MRRQELHVTTSVSKAIRWHDLRATGLTWHAVDGRPATEIRDIAGHTQTSMTDRYLRSAAILRGGRFGKPFPALPESLTDAGAFDGDELPAEFAHDPLSYPPTSRNRCGADGTRILNLGLIRP